MIRIDEAVVTRDNQTIASGAVLHYANLSAGKYSLGQVSVNITGIDTGAKKITVDGDIVAKLADGMKLNVEFSTGNDGEYTIASIALVGGDTEIVVDEAIADATIDGSVAYENSDYILDIDILGHESFAFAMACGCLADFSLRLDAEGAKPILPKYAKVLTKSEYETSGYLSLADDYVKAELEAAGYAANNVVVL